MEVKLEKNRSVVTLGARWAYTERLMDIVRWYACEHDVDLPEARRAVVLAILEVGIEMCEEQIWPLGEDQLWERVRTMAVNAAYGKRDHLTRKAGNQSPVAPPRLRRVK